MKISLNGVGYGLPVTLVFTKATEDSIEFEFLCDPQLLAQYKENNRSVSFMFSRKELLVAVQAIV